MRQASGDLFPTDQPIPASQMIGRGPDVEDIRTALENGTHVILAGARRTGKTSVCEAALTQARARGLYTASVDLFRIADAAELAEAIATAALQNRPAIHRILPKARRAGRSILSKGQLSTLVKATGELGEAVEIAFTPGFAAQDPGRSLAAALELPERIATADGRRFVLFIDEFQEVANPRHPFGDPDALTKQMRAIFQRTAHVGYLFAGSLEHVMRDLFAPVDRAFSGFGGFHTLRPIEAEDWAVGIAERFAADDCTLDPDALDRLIELGGLHPRVTMLIAQQAHLLSIQLGTRRIDGAVVAQAHRAALERDGALLDQLIEQIRGAHKHALRIARRIALGEAVTSGLHAGEADRALKKLMTAGIVERVGRGRYELANPLLQRRLIDDRPF